MNIQEALRCFSPFPSLLGLGSRGPQGRCTPDTHESGAVPEPCPVSSQSPMSCWLPSPPQSPALTGMFQC